MTKYIVTIIVALLASIAQAQDKPKASIFDVAPYVVAIGGNVADVVSTNAAFNRGAHESNPLLPTDAGSIIAAKIGSSTVAILVMRYLDTHGHKTLAKVVGYGTGGLGVALAAHNTRVLR